MTTRLPTDPLPFLTRMPWPDGTPITQEFGAMDSGYPHRGRDAGCVVGTEIVAPAAGKVIDFVNSWTTWNGEQVRSFGNAVCLDFGNGMFGLMAHLSVVDVRIGDQVAAGQHLGLSGNTGVSTGPHCHFQIATTPSFPVDISYSRDPRDFLLTGDEPMTPDEKAAFAALQKEHDELLLAMFSGAEEGSVPLDTRKGYARYRLSEFVEGSADGVKRPSFNEQLAELKK